MLSTPQEHPRQRIMRLVADLLAHHGIVREIAEDAVLTDVGLTSMDMVNLMLAVEGAFDVMIPPADITPETFRSISTIETLVTRLVPAAA